MDSFPICRSIAATVDSWSRRAAAFLTTCVLASCGGGLSSVPPVYTAIFDAGSGGTRLTFYKVIPSEGGYPKIEMVGTYDQDIDGVVDDDGTNDFLNDHGAIKLNGETLPAGCPGISGLQAAVVGPCVLQPLLDQLDNAITTENTRTPGLNLRRSQVKVELFATAGMRTEDAFNGGRHAASHIANYYARMKSYVMQQGFAVGDFRTINGNSEEGVWTWINLNDYYYNAFAGNPTKTAVPKLPVGNVEVGGSSMQIVFPVDSMASDTGNTYAVSINGKSFRVFSKTYLGLGADDVRKYVKAIGYNQHNGGLDCHAATATGANTMEGSGIQLYPASHVSGSAYPFPSNLSLISPWLSLNPTELLLNQPSIFDYARCADKFNTIIAQVVALPRNREGSDHSGALSSIHALKTRLQASTAPLVGLNGFYFVAADLAHAPESGFDPAVLKTRLEAFCAGPVANKKFAQNVCPNGVFMHEFLFGAQGLFTGSGPVFAGVHNTKDNGQTVLTWTRGYLLSQYSK